jgi:hypothetical protein
MALKSSCVVLDGFLAADSGASVMGTSTSETGLDFLLDFFVETGAGSGDSDDDVAEGEGEDSLVVLVGFEVGSGMGDAVF